MNTKTNTELNNNGLDFLVTEYHFLSVQLLAETISFRFVFFFWILAVSFFSATSMYFALSTASISLIITLIWASIIDKTQKSKKRLEVALAHYSIEKNSALEKIYVEWQYEEIHLLTKIFSKYEPHIWFVIAVLVMAVKTYL